MAEDIWLKPMAATLIIGIFAIIFALDRRDEQRMRHASATNARTSLQISKNQQSVTRQSLFQHLRGRFLLRIIKWIATFALATISLAACIYQLGGGPFWWTTPEVEPGPPDYSEPFNVPFTVHNRSTIFSIYVHFYCILRNVTSQHGSTIVNVSTDNGVLTIIQPLSGPSFRCWFPINMNDKIISANIDIVAEYSHHLPWNENTFINAGPFHWDTRSNPARWLKGDIIQ